MKVLTCNDAGGCIVPEFRQSGGHLLYLKPGVVISVELEHLQLTAFSVDLCFSFSGSQDTDDSPEFQLDKMLWISSKKWKEIFSGYDQIDYESFFSVENIGDQDDEVFEHPINGFYKMLNHVTAENSKLIIDLYTYDKKNGHEIAFEFFFCGQRLGGCFEYEDLEDFIELID